MVLLVIACVLFFSGGVAFCLGMLFRRDAAQSQAEGRALDREEAMARKNAAWRLEVEGSYTDGIKFVAQRKWWDSQHPRGMVEGYSIDLGEIEPDPDESLAEFKTRFDEQRHTAEQFVSDLEQTRSIQPN